MFKSLVGLVAMFLVVAFAATVSFVATPYAQPWVTRALDAVFPPGAEPISSPVTTGAPSPNLAPEITEWVSLWPSPAILTFCLLFIGSFLVMNLLVGSLRKALR